MDYPVVIDTNVLHRPKFHFNTENINHLLDSIQALGILVEPPPLTMEFPDQKDLPFYELLIATQSLPSYLITGNIKHFPLFKSIITPNQFLQIYS